MLERNLFPRQKAIFERVVKTKKKQKNLRLYINVLNEQLRHQTQ